MRVLIAALDLFSRTGGGETVYRNIIRRNPAIQFYYLASRRLRQYGLPGNVTAIPFVRRFPYPPYTGDHAQQIEPRAHALARNIAFSVMGMRFDIVDAPDYDSYTVFLPAAFHEHRVVFGKLTQALHGRMSITDSLSWTAPDAVGPVLSAGTSLNRSDRELHSYRSTLRAASEIEDDGLRASDLRYAISKWYASHLTERIGNRACHYVNPLKVLEVPRRDILQSTRGVRSRILYVGRLERRKGPDFFVDLLWFADVQDRADSCMIGADEVVQGESVARMLLDRAARRNVTLGYQGEMGREELLQLLATPSLVLTPSRFDSFNLVALEGLLRGSLVGLTQHMGLFYYLRDELPEIDVCVLDLNNLALSARRVREYLHNFDELRRENHRYLSSLHLDEVYSDHAHADFMLEVYGQTSDSCEQTRDRYRRRYHELLHPRRSRHRTFPRSLKSVVREFVPADRWDHTRRLLRQGQRTVKVVTTILLGQNSLGSRVPFLNVTLRLLITYRRKLCRKKARVEIHGIDVDTMPQIGRSRLFTWIAGKESERGNRLLALLYQCRVARWTGKPQAISLGEDSAALTAHSFPEVMKILPFVSVDETGPEADARVVEYLMSRTRMDFRSDPCVGVTTTARHSNPKPRVSVLVSIYSAQDKLPNFLSHLQHLDMVHSREAEVILVDSGSPVSQFSREELDELASVMDLTHQRTEVRETIQAAWNRALAVARASYITCLGVDEMITSTALSTLAEVLDSEPEVDWVIGNTVIVNVGPDGTVTTDVMAYDRANMTHFSPILDGCYLSYVGAMYRRSLHDRYGRYDPSFHVAGDNEFMHRVLPYIQFRHVNKTLGMFLNYPDERSSHHPRAELEDLRAKYLFWTSGGLRYYLQGRSEAEVLECLRQALGFRMSYSSWMSTDIDVAINLAAHLTELSPDSTLYSRLLSELREIQGYYRQADEWDGNWLELLRLSAIPLRLARLQKLHSRQLGCPVDYRQYNDVRYHVHANIWSLPEGAF